MLEHAVRFHETEIDELEEEMGREVGGAEDFAVECVLDVGWRVAESDEHVSALGDDLHGALGDVEDFIGVHVFVYEACGHLLHV